MLNQFWLPILIAILLCQNFNCELIETSRLDEKLTEPQNTIDIRIGFIVGSRRAKNDRSYSRPGRQLLYAFNYGIDKINQQFSINHSDDQQGGGDGGIQNGTRRVRFVPIVAETFGNESESIKQTIGLITNHRVNFIVGPQETCQVESKLAAVFNVPMISHYCPQYTPNNQHPPSMVAPQQQQQQPQTFIQTKPPHWKIVQRVATLIGQLLSAYNGQWYPQQLVLLYFKEPISGRQSLVDKRTATSNAGWSLNSSSSSSFQSTRWQDTYLANDAIQYKLIGELLEIELNLLFPVKQKQVPINRKQQLIAPLTVLNWHTTFHYGFTKNPFRQIIRRHLFHQESYAATNQSGQCSDFLTYRAPSVVPFDILGNQQTMTKAPAAAVGGASNSQKASIYIIVGHYYEHLGLMLALDELNLLGQQQQQQQQSSVLVNNQKSLVIGVDIEQYDERDDSVRFLRGLLMDEKGGSQHRSSSDVDSIAEMYRHYMGVVPAKPTRMAEFLDDMSSHYNQTSASSYSLLQQQRYPDDTDRAPQTTANQTTLDSRQLSQRLFQFIRLPVEAFYLYDSIMLVGSYFNDCILHKRLTLELCSEGQRAFDWFRNREYSSFVDHNLTRFDSQAQTNGHYTLITRKTINVNESNETTDDDFGLIPVGGFVDGDEGHKIELHVEANGIDPIWLPFWCHMRQSNITECRILADQNKQSSSDEFNNEHVQSGKWQLTAIGLVLVLVAVLYIIGGGVCDLYPKFVGAKGLSTGNSNQIGWFNEKDEQNFLEIVHKFLLAPEILHNHRSPADDEPSSFELDGSDQEQKSMVELHCHMFPFPSCKFVHWVTALLQLKEMMFQYHSSLSCNMDRPQSVETQMEGAKKRFIPLVRRSKRPLATKDLSNRGFFRLKHKGTASLRILLNKYKSINECFCNLGQLDNETIVKLHGASLSHTMSGGGGGKIVYLMVEQPGRGNLRDALENLFKAVDSKAIESIGFRELLVLSSINDLFNGLDYLHKSKVQFHGQLGASNCLLTNDWQLKLSGFHEFHMRRSLGEYEQNNSNKNPESYYNNLIYSAPEIILNHQKRYSISSETLKLADLYSFAFVVYELLVGQEPWSCLTKVTSSRLLVQRVQVDSSFRPPLSQLDKDFVVKHCRMQIDLDVVQGVLRSCWSQSPDRRPQSVESLKDRLMAGMKFQVVRKGQVMELYASLLEQVSICRKNCLEQERQRSKELRLRLLPESIVASLSNNRQQLPKIQQFDCVSLCIFRFVLATDEPSPLEQLNEILIQLDNLVESYRKRIHLMDSQVDSSLRHMIFSGEPLAMSVSQQQGDNTSRPKGPTYNPSQLVASFALQLIDLANRWQTREFNGSSIQVRCGLHSGPVLGGLILGGRGGLELQHGDSTNTGSCLVPSSAYSSPSSCFNSARYVIYGNTLQMADILESSCMAQRIQISNEFRSQILQNPKIPLECGGVGAIDICDEIGIRQGYVMIKREAKISSKIFGEFEAYWLLNGPRLTPSQSIMLLSE